jgi:hypothetical protein
MQMKNEKNLTNKFVTDLWFRLYKNLTNCTKYNIWCCDFFNMCTLTLKMLLMHFGSFGNILQLSNALGQSGNDGCL